MTSCADADREPPARGSFFFWLLLAAAVWCSFECDGARERTSRAACPDLGPSKLSRFPRGCHYSRVRYYYSMYIMMLTNVSQWEFRSRSHLVFTPRNYTLSHTVVKEDCQATGLALLTPSFRLPRTFASPPQESISALRNHQTKIQNSFLRPKSDPKTEPARGEHRSHGLESDGVRLTMALLPRYNSSRSGFVICTFLYFTVVGKNADVCQSSRHHRSSAVPLFPLTSRWFTFC